MSDTLVGTGKRAFGSHATETGEVAQAIRYGLDRRDGLLRLLDGAVSRSTPTWSSDRFAVRFGQKNSLFTGHDLGAEGWAISDRYSRPAS